MSRQQHTRYLQRCVAVSLRKRWPYALIGGALVGSLLLLSAPPLLAGLGAVTFTFVILGGIALDSLRRHAND